MYLRTQKVVAPVLQSVNQRQHLLLVHRVVLLCLIELPGAAGNKPDHSLSVGLRQRRTDSHVRSVRVQEVGLFGVRVHQDGCLKQTRFQDLKCVLLGR